MNKTGASIIAVLLILSLYSCKKEDAGSSYIKPKTNAELLSLSSWKLSDAQYRIDNGDWVNVYANIVSCEADNLLVFPTDSTYKIEEGATKCNGNAPDIFRKGRYDFINNEAQIIFTDTFITTGPFPDTTYIIRRQTLVNVNENLLKLVETNEQSGQIRTDEKIYTH